MLEYFRGWKRKVGLVTLAIACFFAAWWFRSLTWTDRGVYVYPHGRPPIGNTNLIKLELCSLGSWGGRFRLSKDTITEIGESAERMLTRYGGYPRWHSALDPNAYFTTELTSVWGFLGFGRYKSRFDAPAYPGTLFIPYWMIVLPLTLLSAWLLLSKRREPSKPEPSPDPAV